MTRAALGLACVAFVACSGEVTNTAADTDATDSGGTNGTGTDGMGTDGTDGGDEADGTNGTEGGDETGPGSTGDDAEESGDDAEICGNQVLEAGEDCDDGNEVDTDACSNACRSNFEADWTVSSDGGGGGVDLVTRVMVAPDGRVFAVGSSTPPGQLRRAWAAQYSADGRELWSAVFEAGAAEASFGSGLALHEGGDLLISGRTEVAQDESQAFAMRLSGEDGSVVWERLYPLSGTATDSPGLLAHAVVGDSVYAVGRDTTDEGTTGVAMELSAQDGEEVWRTPLPSPSGYEGESTQVLVDGETLYASLRQRAAGGPDLAAVVELSTDGAIVDEHPLGEWRINSIALDPTGSIVAIGSRETTTWDLMVAAFDADFEERWRDEVQGPASSSDFGNAVAVSATGSIVVAGSWGVTNEARNAVFASYAPDGTLLWRTDYNNADADLDDIAFAVATGPEGRVVIGGAQTVLGEDLNIWLHGMWAR